MAGPGTFLIGEAAKSSELSVKTIRYYEEIGLIPKAKRTNGGIHMASHRLYTAADVGRLRFIHHARLIGLSLADIRTLLARVSERGCPGSQPQYRQILERHLKEIDQRIRHLREIRTQIEGLIAPAPQRAGHNSWVSCGCMRPAEPPKSSFAMSAAKGRERGGSRV